MLADQIAPAAHAVFGANLQAGVDAVARAIGVRQAADLAYVFGEGAEHIGPESEMSHLFPSGECAAAIEQLCALAERAIPRLDLSPITELLAGLDRTPIRASWPDAHDWLVVLADLSSGPHLARDFAFTREEEQAQLQFFAALHLELFGPLPVFHSRNRGGSNFVGCPQCVDAVRPTATSYGSYFVRELATAVRDGQIDPAYVPPYLPQNWRFDQPVPADARVRNVRLCWHLHDERPIAAMTERLGRLGFTVTLHRGWGTLAAEKRLERGTIHEAQNWGEAFGQPYGVQWFGAETVFTIDAAGANA